MLGRLDCVRPDSCFSGCPMRRDCPHCNAKAKTSDDRIQVIRDGSFWRKSDGRLIIKFKCRACGKHFSHATFAKEYRQKKRHKNERIKNLLGERCSIRGIARIERLSRTTVLRKLKFLGPIALVELQEMNHARKPITRLQFDDQETAEQSKYKPLAISLAVEEGSRWIAGFEVSEMPVKWKMSPRKRALYGNRKDMRAEGRRLLFARIKLFLDPKVTIISDQHPHYPKSIREHFPLATHVRHKSRRPIDHGQDELKQGFDPMFSLNHTCAKNRDRVARLTRKSWCLSKKKEHLVYHLAIAFVRHNKSLPCNESQRK